MLCCIFQGSTSIMKDRFSSCWEGCLADSAQMSTFIKNCLSCTELPPKLSSPSRASLHPIPIHYWGIKGCPLSTTWDYSDRRSQFQNSSRGWFCYNFTLCSSQLSPFLHRCQYLEDSSVKFPMLNSDSSTSLGRPQLNGSYMSVGNCRKQRKQLPKVTPLNVFMSFHKSSGTLSYKPIRYPHRLHIIPRVLCDRVKG